MIKRVIVGMAVTAILLLQSLSVNAESEVLLQKAGFIGEGLEVIVEEFEVTESGSYQIILNDFAKSQINNDMLQTFSQLKTILVKEETEIVAYLNNYGQTDPFELEVGKYQIVIAGLPGNDGSKVSQYGVEVSSYKSDIETPFSKVGFISGIPNAESSEEFDNYYINTFGVNKEGTYKIYLTNFAFPKMMGTLLLTIPKADQSGKLVELDASESNQVTATFTAEVGTYRVATIAIPESEVGMGIFGIKIVHLDNGEEISVFEDFVTIGEESGDLDSELFTLFEDDFSVDSEGEYLIDVIDMKPGADEFSASSGKVISLEDFGDIKTIILNKTNNNVVFNQSGFFEATEDDKVMFESGDYTIKILSDTKDVSGAMVGMRIRRDLPSEVLYENAKSIGSNFHKTNDFTASFDSYKLLLTDFRFRKLFSNLQVVLTNGIEIVDALSIDYSETISGYSSDPVTGEFFFIATAGKKYQMHVFVESPAPDGDGKIWPAMYGMQLFGSTDSGINYSELEYEGTGAIGGEFFTEGFEFVVEDDGEYGVRLWDFGFPADFPSLNVAVTKGAKQKIAVIYQTDMEGLGSYELGVLEEGKYFVTLVADPSNDYNFGSYALRLEYSSSSEGEGNGEEPVVEPGVEEKKSSGGGGSLYLYLLLIGLSISLLKQKRIY